MGAQNRPQEGRRGERTRLRRRYEPKKVSRELQEAPKKLQSHDLLALPIDYELSKCFDRVGSDNEGSARNCREKET